MLDLLRMLTMRQERPALPGLTVYKVRKVVLKAQPGRKE